MGKVKLYKIRSTTILETIVALVIILAVFGTATTLFVRISATSTSVKKLAAQQVLKAYAENTERRHLCFDEDLMVGRFEVKRQVSASRNFVNLWQIHYYIFDQNSVLLSQWQQYVIAEPNLIPL
jgi:type II secretory pathway pseudopilin PulG